MRKITVFDLNNQLIGDTFPRRAKQLVRGERARWLNDRLDSICLVENITSDKEDSLMEVSGNNMFSSKNIESTHTGPEDINASPAIFEACDSTDETGQDLLMYLAKRNIRLRYNLIRHIILWPAALLFLAFITNGFWDGPVDGAFFGGFFTAWLLVILHKIYVLLYPWFNGRNSFQRVDPVKAEYERLKTIPAEKIAAELKRL